MFFPNDITHLRFQRSQELDAAEGSPASVNAAKAKHPVSTMAA